MLFRGPGDSVAGAAGFSPSHSWERNGQGNGLRLSPQHPPAPSNSKSPADVRLVRRTWRWDPATSRGEGEGRGGLSGYLRGSCICFRDRSWVLSLLGGGTMGTLLAVPGRAAGQPCAPPSEER